MRVTDIVYQSSGAIVTFDDNSVAVVVQKVVDGRLISSGLSAAQRQALNEFNTTNIDANIDDDARYLSSEQISIIDDLISGNVSGDVANHAATHVSVGDDPIQNATQSQDGLMSPVDKAKLDTDVVLRDGSVAFAGDQSMAGYRLTNLGAPTQSTDAATRSFAEAVGSNLQFKQACRLATTTNIALSGTPTIDGVAAIADDRILVKNQTDATENGVYSVAAGAWSRTLGADEDAEVNNGLAVFIASGDTQGATSWILITSDPITLGVTELTFTQLSAQVQHTAGDGLDLVGNEFSVDVTDLIGTGLTHDGSNNLVLDTHGSNHLEGGSDAIPNATGATGGLLSASDKTKLDSVEADAKDDQSAAEVAATTSSFGGKLSGTDDTVQKALDTLDDHVHSHAQLTGTGTDDHHARDHASTHSKGGADQVTIGNLHTGTTDTGLRFVPDGSNGITTAPGISVLRGNTTTVLSSSPTLILNIPLSDNTVYQLNINVVARQTNAANRASYRRATTCFREAGGAATILTTTSIHTHESNAAWDATVITFGNSIQVVATGVVAAIINWKAEVEVISRT